MNLTIRFSITTRKHTKQYAKLIHFMHQIQCTWKRLLPANATKTSAVVGVFALLSTFEKNTYKSMGPEKGRGGKSVGGIPGYLVNSL